MRLLWTDELSDLHWQFQFTVDEVVRMLSLKARRAKSLKHKPTLGDDVR